MDSHSSSPNLCEKIVRKRVYLIAKNYLTGIAVKIAAAPAKNGEREKYSDFLNLKNF
jgi:hypothetical protein